jgi:hypothetical protein
MKSIIRIIMVLAVFGFAMAGSALARENIGEAHVEAGTDTVESIGSASSTASPPPPTPPGTSFAAVNVEPSIGTIDNLVASTAGPTSVVSFVSGTSSSGTGKVLVIPSTEIKTKDVSAITQDMQVMSHIFNKIFKGPRLIGEVFVDYGDFFGRGSRATQSIYLQGYGTLFVMEVDFPFSPPDESKGKTEADTKEGDSVWNQAQKEMFYPTAANSGTRAPAEMYDAEKVEELKTRLIKALKHAANIRNLKSDEQIILTVIGKSRSYTGAISSYGGSGYGSSGARNLSRSYSRTVRRSYPNTRIVPGGISVSTNTVLTIRAKKSDVDAFAKGDLDYEKFREKVQILKYYSLGKNAGGVSFTRQRLPGELVPETAAPAPTIDDEF